MKLVLTKTRAIDFRVSTLPTLYGEKIVMRILDPAQAKLGIDALGYEPEQKETLMDAIQRPYGMVLVTGPTGFRQDGLAVHLSQHPEPAGHQHLHGRGPGRNPARRRQPGQRQRQGRAHVRVGAEGVPAAGPRHHHGRRDPRPGDGRHLDQGRPDRSHGVLDAAHERRADDADATDEHGRAGVQHRVVGDPDHGATAGAEALFSCKQPHRRADRRRWSMPASSRTRTSTIQLDAVSRGRLRQVQGLAATRAGSASIR